MPSAFTVRDLTGRKRRIEILYEDEHLLALNKPAPLLTLPDRWDPKRPNLLRLLQEARGDDSVFVVHRLDAGTSGVIVFAKTREAHRLLCHQFESRQVKRLYEAIVIGNVEKDRGRILKPIAPHPKKPGLVIVSARGKEAITDYEVIERFVGYTYLRLRPRTGRAHQLRVHLQAIGHPIATDPDYGGRQSLYLSEFKGGFVLDEGEEERPFIARPSLHARLLGLKHPATGKRLDLEADVPKDFATFLRILRKYRSLADFLPSEEA
ncbi:MAG: RluA family pseudouridine synthase [candidate division KSB1 bacterium]|nr:RluA family pseudouridine synthase [candidate division KSB1 bacterium]